MRVGREAFDKQYQNKVGQKARTLLHNNSKELTEILKQHNLLQDNFHFFEIGSGGARNLWYFWKENNTLKLSCNDFWEVESKKNMHSDIVNLINFYEGDTEDILKTKLKDQKVDVLLSSDHMMHIPRTKANNIITLIMDEICPSYIVLRERRKEYETPEETARSYPRNYHNYDRFLEKYELIVDEISNVVEYFIRIYKVKK